MNLHSSVCELQCPKCKYAFNYEFVPGMSVASVRLGSQRYMKCPNCNKWSTFKLHGNIVKRSNPSLPMYSDSKTAAKYSPLAIVPLFAWVVIVMLFSENIVAYGSNLFLFIAIVPSIILAVVPMALVMRKSKLTKVNKK